MENGAALFVGMNGGFGPLAQVMPIVNELEKYGLQIICHNYRAAAEMVKKMNYSFFELPETLGRPERANPNGPEWWNADYQWSKHGYLDYNFTKRLIGIFTDAIVKYQPKAIISVQFPALSVVARRLSIPLVCVTQACLHKCGRGGRITWWKELPPNLDRSSPVVNKILTDMGLEPIERMEDLHEGDITIVPSIPEFDVIQNAKVFYTGPMFWQGPGETLGADYQVKKQNPYLIHVYTGHLFNGAGRATGIILLEQIVKALNDTEFDVIISTGSGQKVPEDIKPADNIKILDWVPTNQLIPQCDLIIHHGGHGYSLQGLAHGVPALVIPMTDEREYNARQLVDLGAGLFIPPGEVTPDLLLEKVRKMVQDLNLHENSRAISEVIKRRNYQGASQAAQMIIELINSASG